MDIKNSALKLSDRIIAWRRELHQNPEVGFELPRTEAMILRELAKMGFKDVKSGMGGGGKNGSHGVCVTLQGALPGKNLALRADMDALPVVEDTGLPFASQNGSMHACGHDAHIAMLLGAAQILIDSQDKLKGTVRLIFQPSEEDNGSPSMIASGALENPKVDAIIGLHTGNLWEGLKPGQIGFRSGPFMAACEKVDITLYGKGGHGATPQKTIDPIVMASQAICQLQTLVSREISPFDPAVVTIGELKAGSSFNIIANKCSMSGTLRTFKPGLDAYIRDRVRATVEGVASSMRGRAEVEFSGALKSVVNERFYAEKMRDVAAEVLGEEMVCEIAEPASVSEDFCWYLQEVPGSFFAHCATFEDERDYPHHHPKFDVNESVLWTGSCGMAAFALKWQD